MKAVFILGLATAGLMACEQTPRTYTPEQAQKICAEERRQAEGPRTDVTLGANSRTGAFTNVNINISDKFIRGVDPNKVYSDCMARLPIS